MMNRAGFKITALIVAGAFSIAALFCCYRHSAVDGNSSKKSSCCAAKETSKHSNNADCSSCPIVHKLVDVWSQFTLNPQSISNVVVFNPVYLVLTPTHVIAPVFLHGPPGPIAVTPLYIQLHCLRL